MRAVLAVVLVAACGKPDHAKLAPEPPPLALAEQPEIKTGVREIYSIMLDDLPEADRPAALDRAVRAIRGRLQLARIIGHVAADGDKLVINLAPANPETLEHARELIARTGHLAFHFGEPSSAFMQSVADHVRADPGAATAEIAVALDRWVAPDHTHVDDPFLEAPDRRREGTMQDVRAGRCFGMEQAGGDRVWCRESGRDAIAAYLHDAGLTVPDNRRLGYEHLPPHEGSPNASWRTYLLERRVVLAGSSIRRATARFDSEYDRWVVEAELDRAATQTFADETSTHVGRKLALELDGRVMAAPLLDSPITRGRLLLPFGSGDPRGEAEARDLAIVLTAGELPGPVREEVRAKLVDGVPRD